MSLRMMCFFGVSAASWLASSEQLPFWLPDPELTTSFDVAIAPGRIIDHRVFQAPTENLLVLRGLHKVVNQMHLLHFFEAQAACPNDIFIHPGLWVEGGHVKAVRDANVTAQRSSPRDSNGHIASLLCRFPPQLYSTHIWLLIFP